jgi:hypothetical protein
MEIQNNPEIVIGASFKNKETAKIILQEMIKKPLDTQETFNNFDNEKSGAEKSLDYLETRLQQILSQNARQAMSRIFFFYNGSVDYTELGDNPGISKEEFDTLGIKKINLGNLSNPIYVTKDLYNLYVKIANDLLDKHFSLQNSK